ncbi:hypothetical protein K435DRAFT_776070 [Dendrothele bispora CBS 962.96]|uniref:GET complex, subunit GET2 n=1 Tax=Dendrothele bispora (strain CBS 962.96) TaxID=1314807 RepID=A0A4S8MGG6_DENBC|nr:hypothetical protein K435DRAFT_776070 [Dendrothele bispora CBS 962.96]
MSAAARAEARRKAILSRGNDRLAKLTTSARGDDPAYKHDDPPLPDTGGTPMRPSTSTFLGEETHMPTPPLRASPSPGRPASDVSSSSPSSSPSSNTTRTAVNPEFEPGVWSQDQQQLMQALLSGMGMGGMGEGAFNAGGAGAGGVPPSLADNPLAALLMGGMNGGAAGFGQAPALGAAPGVNGKKGDGVPPLVPPGFGPGLGAGMGPGMATEPPKPKTLLQRLMPLVHWIAMWALLAYFVLFREPQVHEAASGSSLSGSGWQGIWSRWSELEKRNPLDTVGTEGVDGVQGWTVAVLPFFYAFISLQIGLHSIRIFSGFDKPQPPALLALALPHLPAPIPSIVINGMKYLQMASVFFDDFALVAFGMGILVWVAGLMNS